MVLAGCGTGNARDKEAAIIDTAVWELPLPTLPDTMRRADNRAAYIALHFWDQMPWEDSAVLASERIMGTAMANYAMMLDIAPRDRANLAVIELAQNIADKPAGASRFLDLASQYLFNPGSPQYDPEIYLLVIDAFLARRQTPEAWQIRLAEQRREVMKNREGAPAANFEYIDSNGRRTTLYDQLILARKTLLVLYDPDCEVCVSVLEALAASNEFIVANQAGDIQMLVINPFGKDGQKNPADYPNVWKWGYSPDGQIDADELYSMRATPAIYLIDATGKIERREISPQALPGLIPELIPEPMH